MSCLTTRKNLPLRYTNNVYHQAELVFPMLVHAHTNSSGKIRRIHWTVEPLPWSLAMLRLIIPEALITVSPDLPARGVCRIFGMARVAGSYFQGPYDAFLVRSRVLQACSVRLYTSSWRRPHRFVYMPRTGTALQSGIMRNFAREEVLLDLIRRLLPTVRMATTPTPSAQVHICDQVKLWANSDLILTPNGAHFVNAPFMRPGAVLIEGVPWSMRAYLGQLEITRFSEIVHVRLYSARPPPSKALVPFNRVETEQLCAANEICSRRYRDHSNIWVSSDDLARLLHSIPYLSAHLSRLTPSPPPSSTDHLTSAASMVYHRDDARCTDTPYWMNHFGRTCADYARVGEASERGEAGGGGWCANGALKPLATWAGGPSFGFPEFHCCACGRAKSALFSHARVKYLQRLRERAPSDHNSHAH